jgi:type I restriction enzyme S subunit
MTFGWEAIPIGEVATPIERPEPPQPGVTYRQIGVRLWGEGAYERDSMDGADTQYKTLNRVESNDIIVNKIWARNGSVSVVNEALAGCYCSGEFPLFRPNPDELESKWFYWITKARWFWNSCDKKSRGTSGKNRIKPHKFLEIGIPLPPLTEQRRIVAKIESLAARIDEAKQLRQAIQSDMDSLLVAMAHRNDLSDEEKQAQGWERVALGEVLTQVSDPVDVEPGGEYPHFGIYSFAKGLFKKAPLLGDEIKAAKLYRVHEGQFIYGRLNAYEGAFAVIDADYDGGHVSNEFPAFECDRNRILPDFLLAYFSTPAVWEALKRKVTGIGGGAGNRRIRLKESVLLSDEIWLPPIDWQRKIKSTAEKLAASKTDREAVGVELDALLPSILDRAFKGNL